MRKLLFRFVFCLGVLALFAGCSKDEKGSAELSEVEWISAKSQMAAETEDKVFLTSVNHDYLLKIDPENETTEKWDVLDDLNIDGGEIISLTAYDHQLAIQVSDQLQKRYLVLWNTAQEKEIGRIPTSAVTKIDEENLWMIDGYELSMIALADQTEIGHVDLSGYITEQTRIDAVFKQHLWLDISNGASMAYLYIDFTDPSTPEISCINTEPLENDLDITEILLSADQDGVYFIGISGAEMFCIKRNWEGKNPELLWQNHNVSISAISKDGIYNIKNLYALDTEPGMTGIAITFIDEDSEVELARISDAESLNLSVTDHFIILSQQKTNGESIRYLMNPSSGDYFLIDQEKWGIYRQKEESALEGIEVPMDFKTGDFSASSYQNAGNVLQTTGSAAEFQGMIYAISEDYTSLLSIDPKSMEFETVFDISAVNGYYLETILYNEKHLLMKYHWIKGNVSTIGVIELDPSTSDILWKQEDVKNPLLSGNCLYFSDQNGNLVELDLDEKTERYYTFDSLNAGLTAGKDQNGDLWAVIGTRECDLYRYESEELMLAARCSQLDTWNDQSFYLTGTRDGIRLKYWYAEDGLGDVCDYYQLNEYEAIRYLKSVPLDAVLTDQGAFFVLPYSHDPLKGIPSDSDFSTVYYQDFQQERSALLTLECSDVRLDYLPSLNKLLLLADDWKNEVFIWSWLDLDTLKWEQLRKVQQ